jgi:predicted ester cyclase
MEATSVVARFVDEAVNGKRSADELVSDPLLRQQIGAFLAAFPDLEVTTHVLIEDGDLVGGHFSGRGTHSGLFAGVPPTGRRWEARCTAVYRVTDGRIAEAWVTWDELALLEQLGAVARVETVSA